MIALSETEAAKLFGGDTRSDIGSEAEKMKYANAVNGLVVRFIRLGELNEDTEIDVGISALRSQVGERLFARFVEQELKELQAFRAFLLSR